MAPSPQPPPWVIDHAGACTLELDFGHSLRESRRECRSLRQWGNVVPRRPFRFGDGPTSASVFEVEIERGDAGLSGGYRLRLVHRAGPQRLSFDIEDESAGTRTWFGLIGPVLSTLRTGQVLLVDEIDASLHPKLSAHLLTLFQDPHSNPRGAQLIFTTRDTSLLGQLNRDEVWLTEKGDDGATQLIALAEYGGDRVRRSTNLERAYLQGRFGAIPQIDTNTLRRALEVAEGGR